MLKKDLPRVRFHDFEATLKEQPYFGGATATYADYLLFSVFQYARLGCHDEFVAEDSALAPLAR